MLSWKKDRGLVFPRSWGSSYWKSGDATALGIKTKSQLQEERILLLFIPADIGCGAQELRWASLEGVVFFIPSSLLCLAFPDFNQGIACKVFWTLNLTQEPHCGVKSPSRLWAAQELWWRKAELESQWLEPHAASCLEVWKMSCFCPAWVWQASLGSLTRVTGCQD